MATQKAILDLSVAEGSVKLNHELLINVNLTPEYMSILPSSFEKNRLRQLIGEYYGVSKDNIVLGNGSDELIEAIAYSYKDKVSLTLIPTFGRLINAVKKYRRTGVSSLTFKLNHSNKFIYDDEAHNSLLSIIKEQRIGLLLLCSPNNPTGTIFSLSQISELASSVVKGGVVVVDEVFIDFLDNARNLSALKLINNTPNLIVLNSFSKTWGLAALRVGMAFTSKEIVEMLNKSVLMYSLNSVAMNTAINCLNSPDYRVEQIINIHKNRNEIVGIIESINSLDLVDNTSINLLCLAGKAGVDIYEELLSYGVISKQLNKSPGFEGLGYVRLLVPNNKTDTNILVLAIKSIGNKYADSVYGN